jgi:RHS repeat-associated protein
VKSITLDVSGKQTMKLVTDKNGDYMNDHTDWADARLVKFAPARASESSSVNISGAYYLRARYYDPANARMLSEDPVRSVSHVSPNGNEIVDPLSLNLYTYSYNNPVQYNDSSGRFAILTAVAVVVIGGVVSGAVDITSQLIQNGGDLNKVDWRSVGASAAGGTAATAVFMIAGPAGGLVSAVVTGGTASATGYTVNKVVKGETPTITGTMGSYAVGGATSGVLYGVASRGVYRTKPAAPPTVCFTGETLVKTKDGHKEIKDISVRDEVYSENVETGEQGYKKVKNIYVNEANILIHVKACGVEINTTEEHPFYAVGLGWVSAKSLEIGDELKLANGETSIVELVEAEMLVESMMVYNFEVEDWHTYFVSANEVFVHNACSLKAGDKTINGYELTTHAANHANERGFSIQRIDSAIDSYSKKFYTYGEEIYCKKVGNYYDVVIKSRSNNKIVTVIGGNTNSLKTVNDIEKFFRNSGNIISTIPLD